MWWQIVQKHEKLKLQGHDQVKTETFILAFVHLDDKIHSAIEHGLNVLEAKNDKNQQIINYLINFV